MKENLQLKKQPAKLQKENDFFKKNREAFFAKKIDLEASYNYLKNRKADYHQQKDEIKDSIREIYHFYHDFIIKYQFKNPKICIKKSSFTKALFGTLPEHYKYHHNFCAKIRVPNDTLTITIESSHITILFHYPYNINPAYVYNAQIHIYFRFLHST